ncbi:phosphoribosylglycinamide formyltransferase [Planomicrobium chinense]|uniref:phosphoribosylglycinamide formyltransferase n=1 Tax=Planococcus chinensis TaxID=272917 RepID=UPI001CC4A9EE|nr:phosphoribosylglycinamide formyltransferase [Planococcus chinensis]MBZ5202735.1 phosphoribosylglycinamide formyltransferase [Planococcus chinensis]MCP2036669.1 phosphoribosylglycinamide formyltransferase-1 [Planomicrobium sp. HSC-17F08]
MNNKPKIAVFASGNGSNFQAIADAVQAGQLEAELALVVTDRPSAFVVERAKDAGIASFAFVPKEYDSKQLYEEMLKEKLQQLGVEWIVLAGYMRLIGSVLLEAYENRIINIHPSVLPAFPGKDAIGQTMASGAETAGVTVHYVDAGMDTGQIIAQQSFAVNGRDREAVEQEIHAIEHQLYPATLQRLLNQ